MATIASTRADKTGRTMGLRGMLLFLASSGCVFLGPPWKSDVWNAGIGSRDVGDHRDIRGTWQVVVVEDCGQRMPVERGMKTVVFTGDAVRLLDRGTPVAPCGSFVLDPERKTIDLEDETVRTAHGTYPGLYELIGDRLTLCMGRPGQARPSDFGTSPRNMHTLLIMERE
jgi:uncharacterized protein (TIGR03067 family)